MLVLEATELVSAALLLLRDEDRLVEDELVVIELTVEETRVVADEDALLLEYTMLIVDEALDGLELLSELTTVENAVLDEG